MVAVTGLGPWPGTDPLAAAQTVVGELTSVPGGVDGIPFLPQLPGRGPGADALGRSASLLTDLPSELGPHGWKLADHPGGDLRRAAGYLQDDISALAIAGLGYEGHLATTVLGPWSLAAELYLARGDRVLTDAGATADLTASLAAGVGEHIADLRRQVPGARVVVHVDELHLAKIAAGALPTFSGYSRIRAVHPSELMDGLTPFLAAVHDAGARAVVHPGPTGVPVAANAGADAISVPIGGWDERLWTLIARATERGLGLWALLDWAQLTGLNQGRNVNQDRFTMASRRDGARGGHGGSPGPEALADLVTTGWQRIGLPVRALAGVTLLAGSRPAALGGPVAGTVAEHRAVFSNLGRVASVVGERAQG